MRTSPWSRPAPRRVRQRRPGRDRLHRRRRGRGPAGREPPPRPRRHRDPRRLRPRAIEGKIAAAGFAREHEIPCLGLCLGLQTMGHRVRPQRLRPSPAPTPRSSTLTRPIRHRPDGRAARGGRLRRAPSAWACTRPARRRLQVAAAYGEPLVYERHRHRYEFNSRYAGASRSAACARWAPRPTTAWWSSWSSTTPVLDRHPGPPEFKSRPDRPHPLFQAFVAPPVPGRGPGAPPPPAGHLRPVRACSAV